MQFLGHAREIGRLFAHLSQHVQQALQASHPFGVCRHAVCGRNSRSRLVLSSSMPCTPYFRLVNQGDRRTVRLPEAWRRSIASTALGVRKAFLGHRVRQGQPVPAVRRAMSERPVRVAREASPARAVSEAQ